MKRFFTYLSALLVAAACAPQLEINYDHEAQAFETRSDRILVEAILPQATAAGNEVYIVGAFNGYDAAIGNSVYKLTRSENNPAKWGIYLDPAAFQGGKSLADGFTFYNVQQGYERSSRNETVMHTLTIGPGEWANVYADKWEAYFDPDSWSGGDDEGIVLPDHDGTYRVYIINNTGWNEVNLYMYGDVNNLGGGWPGIPAATVEIDGSNYTCFDVDAAEATGKSEHLIFNGDGAQIPGEAEPYVTFGDEMDLFFDVTATSAEELDKDTFFSRANSDARAAFTEDSNWGITGSIASTGNNWGQDGDADIAMKTDGNWHAAFNVELTTSDQLKFRLDGAWTTNYGGKLEALGSFFEAVPGGDNLTVPEDGVFDLFLNPGTAEILVVKAGDPVNFPTVEPDEEDGARIFIRNDVFAEWGTSILATYWPEGATKNDKGSAFERTSVTLEEGAYPETFWVATTRHSKRGQEVELKVFPEADAIFFYGKGDELPQDRELKVATINTKLDTDRYFILSKGDAEGEYKLTEIDMGVHLFVDNQTYWPGELLAHAWVGDGSAISTSWPGVTGVPGFDENGNEYTTFFLPKQFRGETAEVIFHSDVDDEHNRFQVAINLEKDCYYTLKRDITIDPIQRADITVLVDDQTGWADVRLYAWGDKEVCGGWPGIAPEANTVKLGTVNYKVFVIPEAEGRTEHLILNNNNNGAQTPDLDLTFDGTRYYAKAEKVTDGESTSYTFTTVDPTDVDIKILVKNDTDWEEITLYAWSSTLSDSGIFGGWPGATPVGTEVIDGVEYTVFGLDGSLAGETINLIFNNNGKGTQLPDYAITVPEKEIFLSIKANYVVGNVDGNPRGEPSVIYVQDKMGWGGNLHLYAWGDTELFGGWPGVAGTYVGTFCGVPTYSFPVAAEVAGNTENLIFNNGNGGDGNQFNGPTVKVGEDLNYLINSDFTYETGSYATRVYVLDETGWEAIALYVWGTTEIFGGWPGAAPAGTQEVGGKTYKYFDVPESAFGNTANFILNNNGGGVQLENFNVLKGQTINRDFYFHFTPDNVTVVE